MLAFPMKNTVTLTPEIAAALAEYSQLTAWT
jgi:hypothetical protein